MDHATDAVLCGSGNLHGIHAAVFPEVHLAVYNGVTEIPHIGISGNGAVIFFQFLMLIFRNLGIECGYRFRKLSAQIFFGIGLAGAVHTEPGGIHDHFAQDHFRVLHKVAVHSDAVGIGVQMHPIRFNVRHPVPLLQEQNITGDFRTGVAFERIVGQSDGTDQVGPLCKIFPHGGVFFIHGAFGSDECHDAAGSDLIQCLSEEIIMDQPMMLVIPLVQHLEITKGNIADSHIKEAVGHLHLFKAGHSNGTVLIELLGNPSGDRIQFHTVGMTACHGIRDHTNEIADTAGGFQDVALFESHVMKGLIHGPDDDRGSVKGSQAAFSGSIVFLYIQKVFQFLVFGMPVIEPVGQTTPAHILRKDFLFLRGCQSALGFYLFQALDSGNIGSIFLGRSAISQFRIINPEVVALLSGNVRIEGFKGDMLPFRLCFREFQYRLFRFRKVCYRGGCGAVGAKCFFRFFQSGKAASGGIGKVSFFVIAITDMIFAAGILLNDDPFLVGQIPGHNGGILCLFFG